MIIRCILSLRTLGPDVDPRSVWLRATDIVCLTTQQGRCLRIWGPISGIHYLPFYLAIALHKVFFELDTALGRRRLLRGPLPRISRVRNEMDPLSVAAGILAIIGAGSTVGKGLKKIISARRLPDILLQLNNEVADLQYVVQDIQNLLQQQSQANRDGGRLLTTNQSLTSALERAKETLLALESLIAYQLTTVDSRTGRTNIDWISWLRVEPKVKSLKADIRTDRVRLSSALSLLAS